MASSNDDGRLLFELNNGTQFELVKFVAPTKLLVWEKCEPKFGMNEDVCRSLNVKDVDVQTLKDINVWDKLEKKTQDVIKTEEENRNNRVRSNMEHARKHRKRKYAHIPREIKSIKCGLDIKIIAGQVAKKLEVMDISIEKYIEQFKCRICNPVSRGRKPNPKFAKIPKELKCECGNSVKVAASNIVSRAETKGVTVEEFLKNYKCQKCNPTRGRHLKKKVKKNKAKKKK